MLTGSKELNDFLGEYKKEITYIYGEYATGKTTMCIMAAIDAAKNNRKVVYIDTENGFSIDRIRQIAGFNYISLLDKILLLKINSFDEQCSKITLVKNLVNIDLIIIDSIGSYYRKVLKESPSEINYKMDMQMKTLNKIAKKTPIIITNQVYTNIDTNKITPVGGEMIKKYGSKIIFLDKNPKKMVLNPSEKNEDKMLFDIKENGIVKL